MSLSTYNSKAAFTLVEIIVVVTIISMLFIALYMGAQPYMKRARDTKRITSLYQYTSVLEAYDKNFDTFPSNLGAGGIATQTGYCLSELPGRGDVSALGKEGRFSFLATDTSAPPVDPTPGITVTNCSMSRSFVYSRLDYSIGKEKQLAIIAARLETRSAANYGTGSSLINKVKYQEIIDAKKGTVPNAAPDALFVVTMLH